MRAALLALTLRIWFHARAARMGNEQKQERGANTACIVCLICTAQVAMYFCVAVIAGACFTPKTCCPTKTSCLQEPTARHRAIEGIRPLFF